MIRILLVLVMLLAVPVGAAAQKDRMQFGEALGATVIRSSRPELSPIAPSPTSRDQLTPDERLIPVKKEKGA